MTKRIILFLLLSMETFLHASPESIKITAGQFHDEDGFWLTSSKLEAFVTADPHLRMRVFRVPGGSNLLREEGPEPTGLRTWIMNPSESLEFRGEVSELPAESSTISHNTLSLKAGTSDALGLQLEWNVSFNESGDHLILRHTLTNHGEVPQPLALWSLAVVPGETLVRVPFDSPHRVDNPKFPYRLYVFPYSNLKDSRMRIADDHLEISVVHAPDEGALKIGVVSTSGTLIAEQGSLELASTVDYEPAATYPEGGANLTVYALGKETRCLAELEHMSPVQTVQPGASISMVQRLSISPVNGKPTIP